MRQYSRPEGARWSPRRSPSRRRSGQTTSRGEARRTAPLRQAPRRLSPPRGRRSLRLPRGAGAGQADPRGRRVALMGGFCSTSGPRSVPRTCLAPCLSAGGAPLSGSTRSVSCRPTTGSCSTTGTTACTSPCPTRWWTGRPCGRSTSPRTRTPATAPSASSPPSPPASRGAATSTAGRACSASSASSAAPTARAPSAQTS
mmetsp:Transcript_12172/g.30517  ORF Transcript_12172/g.30517 Transcript_12172/m.30517 type:complete len:200 (+) Transcript_12172:262-861(+)